MSNTCPCGEPTRDAFICGTCTTALERTISDLSAHWHDLDNVRAKLVRYGGQGGRGMDHRLPIDPRFAAYVWVEASNPVTGEQELQAHIPHGTALLDAARNTVATWTRLVVDHEPVVTGPECATACLHLSCTAVRRTRPPADTIASCCRYLLRNANRIRVRPWAPDILDELDHLEQQLRWLVDRPADTWYVGPCDQCERDLYAKTGAASATCPECQLDYDVEKRRGWLLEQAESRLVNATMLARAVSWLGAEPLTAERVRKWAERKRIAVKGHETRGGRTLPLYRIGDALDLLAGDTQKAG